MQVRVYTERRLQRGTRDERKERGQNYAVTTECTMCAQVKRRTHPLRQCQQTEIYKHHNKEENKIKSKKITKNNKKKKKKKNSLPLDSDDIAGVGRGPWPTPPLPTNSGSIPGEGEITSPTELCSLVRCSVGEWSQPVRIRFSTSPPDLIAPN
jgi:hypothetical protein